MQSIPDLFIEVDHYQACKHGQPAAGDVFLSHKEKTDDRIVSVLADGLGSGIKANVLATLTSTMALQFVSHDTDIKRAACTIMDILPVCKIRKIAYSTFTIVDIETGNDVRMIEHDNPNAIVIRNGQELELSTDIVALPPTGNVKGERELRFTNFKAEEEDRILFFSDGVNQAGMGTEKTPLGLGRQAVVDFILRLIRANKKISAREIARRIVDFATAHDGGKPKDDITCGVVYFRRPRRLLLATGPPYADKSDAIMARSVKEFDGMKIVSGGTTASIVSRELKRPIEVDLQSLQPGIPPISKMKGINLITEGTITLARVAEMLEHDIAPENEPRNGATLILEYFLNSDIIHFLVGTRINEAHQDPNIPVQLDLRRNLLKRIAGMLEEKHLKGTHLHYI